MFAENSSAIATGQKLQLARKKCMVKSCFKVQEKRFWREISHHFLLEMDVGSID